MKYQDLVTVVSSSGFVVSVKDTNIVTPPEPNLNAFAWKQLSIVAKQDCTIEINKESHNPSTVSLVANLALELDRLSIKSLEFKEDAIEYYFIAGY